MTMSFQCSVVWICDHHLWHHVLFSCPRTSSWFSPCTRNVHHSRSYISFCSRRVPWNFAVICDGIHYRLVGIAEGCVALLWNFHRIELCFTVVCSLERSKLLFGKTFQFEELQLLLGPASIFWHGHFQQQASRYFVGMDEEKKMLFHRFCLQKSLQLVAIVVADISFSASFLKLKKF